MSGTKGFILGIAASVMMMGGIGMISMAKAPAKVETVKPVHHAKPKAKHHAKAKRHHWQQPSMAEIERRVTTIEERIDQAEISLDIKRQAAKD